MTARRIDVPVFPWLDASKYSFSLGVEAADATWLSGQTAAAYDSASGRVEIRGDPGAQAALCWEKVEAVLAGAPHALSTCSELVEYLTPEGLAQREAVAAARRSSQAASIIVVESLLRPEAHVEVEVVAGDSGGLIRLPQVLPIGKDGNAVAPGDLVAQAEFVLEEAGRQLASRGLDLSHVVRTVEQTTAATRGDYAGTGSARKRLLGPAYPTSTGLISPTLPHPEALIALEVWASPHPKRIINPGWSAFDRFTFSPGVAAGELLFISGTTAFDADRGKNVHHGDIAAQAAFIYEQIAAVCEASGVPLANIIKTVEYITPAGVSGYREVGALRKRLFSDPFPASTGVVVESLLHPSWLIEIEALAVLS